MKCADQQSVTDTQAARRKRKNQETLRLGALLLQELA